MCRLSRRRSPAHSPSSTGVAATIGKLASASGRKRAPSSGRPPAARVSAKAVISPAIASQWRDGESVVHLAIFRKRHSHVIEIMGGEPALQVTGFGPDHVKAYRVSREIVQALEWQILVRHDGVAFEEDGRPGDQLPDELIANHFAGGEERDIVEHGHASSFQAFSKS